MNEIFISCWYLPFFYVLLIQHYSLLLFIGIQLGKEVLRTETQIIGGHVKCITEFGRMDGAIISIQFGYYVTLVKLPPFDQLKPQWSAPKTDLIRLADTWLWPWCIFTYTKLVFYDQLWLKKSVTQSIKRLKFFCFCFILFIE